MRSFVKYRLRKKAIAECKNDPTGEKREEYFKIKFRWKKNINKDLSRIELCYDKKIEYIRNTYQGYLKRANELVFF